MDDMIDGSVMFQWQLINMRALTEDCCGWNKKTWADAVEFAFTTLPDDLRGKEVIEIGASEKSTLSPIFAAKGAHVICSYYSKTPGFKKKPTPNTINFKYHIAVSVPTIEINVMELTERFDIIVMKSVLGGVFKNDDYEGIKALIQDLLKNHLTPSGVIITIDNGYITPFYRLRRLFGTGGSRWSYLKQSKLAEELVEMNGSLTIKGFGYLNVASAWLQLERFKFGRKFEFLNTIVYYLDKIILAVFKPYERAVLTTIIRR